ncbi:MAG: EAL domain-containing protein [Proteobacteria bacterium]|nr:EAL domain-containing protein [Pseudomonadota bacterium]HQR03669.1 EAL domain-containing protein [Rhodocyclaceae bacterium]
MACLLLACLLPFCRQPLAASAITATATTPTTATTPVAPGTPATPGALHVVLDDNYPPFIFRDSAGKATGFLVDLWDRWSQQTGVPVRLDPRPWPMAWAAMANGEADAIDAVFFTPERNQHLDFSRPYADVPVSVYTDAGIGGITDIASLRGMRVGTQSGDVCEEFLRRQGITTLRSYVTAEALISAAAGGEVKIFCLGDPAADYLLYRAGIASRFHKAFVVYSGQLHRAVRKGDRATLLRIERGFAVIPPGEMEALQRKWMGQPLASQAYSYLPHALIVVLVLGAAVFAWSLLLRRQVARRTRQLESEHAHLQTLIRSIPDMVWLKDTEGVYQYCNTTFEQFYDIPPTGITGKTDFDLVEADIARSFRHNDQIALAATTPCHFEERFGRGNNGHPVLTETIKTALRDGAGRVIGVLGIAHDITPHREMVEGLAQSNRALRILTEINRVLIRCTTRPQLVSDVCDILVHKGGYRLAWVGLVNEDAGRTVSFIAHASHVDEKFEPAPITWADTPAGQGPVGRCIRTDQPVITRRSDPALANSLWRNFAQRYGYHASIVLPLRNGAGIFGVLSIYAGQEDALHDDEVTLLTELADDLAFGMETLRQRNIHARAESAMASQAAALEGLVQDQSLQAIFKALMKTQVPGVRTGVLLLDPAGQHTLYGEIPDVPEGYVSMVRSGGPDPSQTIRSVDIATDPLWAEVRDPILALGLRACWLSPMHDDFGTLLGFLLMYWESVVRDPDEQAFHLTRIAVHTAILAVEYAGKAEALRRSEAHLAEAQRRIGLGSWEYDLASGHITWSAEMFRLFHQPPEHGPLRREEFALRLHPDDQPATRQYDADVTTGGEPRASFEFRSHPDLGPVRHFSGNITPIRAASGRVTALIGTVLDITERKQQEARIEQLAFYDTLTGLPHRALFADRLDQTLATAAREQHSVALFFLDLNRFKEINDSQGHDAGDQVLVEVAHRLQAQTRQGETLARLGGDEFTLIVGDARPVTASRVAERIARAFDKPFLVDGRRFNIGVSIGIALYPGDGDTAQALISRADMAMYQAKAHGGGYHFYSADMSTRLDHRLTLAQGLELALTENRLQLYYQPQVRLSDNRLIGAEVLLRWPDPERGWISPAEFIPVAEERGMMGMLGEWILDQAARQLAAWRTAGVAPPGRLAVNVSARQLAQPRFAETVQAVMDRYRLSPEMFELELTESALMDDPEHAVRLMDTLKQKGFAIAIDDFGTGYSSLAYLKRFPADKLKIDMSFVRDMLTDRNDHNIVTTIIAMARSLGLATIAEGVEEAGQCEQLRALGCDEVQGYYFGRPEPADDFIRRWCDVSTPTPP